MLIVDEAQICTCLVRFLGLPSSSHQRSLASYKLGYLSSDLMPQATEWRQ